MIDSLRKAADDRVRLLWQDAESEAGKARAETARRLEQLRSEVARTEAATARERNAQAVTEANSRARVIRLSAEKALADRLQSAAAASLRRLRGNGYEAVFGQLARELPPLPWRTVRVNPDDVALAQKLFPQANVVPDPRIAGGLDVTTDDNGIRIVNTFEKRLERAWSEMLPGLIKEAYREASDGTAPAS